jgi:signal transduction histidine kinase
LLFLEDSSRHVNHSHVVLEQLSTFSSDLKDVQRGVRGFIISGNSEYLLPYQESMTTISNNLDTLRALTFDHRSHQLLIDSLQTFTADFLSYYTKLAESRTDQGLDSVIAIVREGKGKKLTDKILGIVDRMRIEELSLLDLREVEVRAAGWKMSQVLMIGTSVALFFIVLSSALVVRENSRRQRAEESLHLQAAELRVAKETAESADRLKSIFLATMSHELRTPLNSVIGYTDIIRQGRSGPVNPEQIEQLGKVLNNSRYLLRLINDALDISKIEAGKITIVQWPFHAGESIQKCVSMVSPLAEQKGLRMECSISTTVGEMQGDQQRVEQILINILNNAVKFTADGVISVNASFVWSGTREVLRVRVTDTGIGILAEEIPNLFQPFHQVSSGVTRSQEGTGLGLSISKKLSALLDGDISVTSDYGKGSTFEITIPTRNR